MQYRVLFSSVFFTVLFFLPHSIQAQNWRVIKRIDANAQPHGTQNYIMNDSMLFEYDANTMRGSNYNNDSVKFRLMYHYKIPPNQITSLYRRTYCSYSNDDLIATRAVWDANGIWERDTFFYKNNSSLIDSHHFYNIAYIAGTPRMVLYSVFRYEYNTNGQPVKKTWYTLRNIGQYPGLNHEDFYFYDSAGRLTQNVTREYGGWAGIWSFEKRRLYKYDTAGNEIEYELYHVDSFGTVVLWDKKYSYYDTNNRLIGDSLSVTTANPFSGHESHAYTYDSVNRLKTDTLKSSGRIEVSIYDYTSFGYVDEINIAVGNASGLNLGYRTKYTYEQYTVTPIGVEGQSANNTDITLYPNPATNTLYIATKETYKQGLIYNSMGQLVKHVNANSKQVDISKLPTGSYYLLLTTNDKTMSKAFIVKR